MQETPEFSIKSKPLADDVDDLSISAGIRSARSWPFSNARHVFCSMAAAGLARSAQVSVASDSYVRACEDKAAVLCRCLVVSVAMLTPTCLLSCCLATCLLTVTPPIGKAHLSALLQTTTTAGHQRLQRRLLSLAQTRFLWRTKRLAIPGPD